MNYQLQSGENKVTSFFIFIINKKKTPVHPCPKGHTQLYNQISRGGGVWVGQILILAVKGCFQKVCFCFCFCFLLPNTKIYLVLLEYWVKFWVEFQSLLDTKTVIFTSNFINFCMYVMPGTIKVSIPMSLMTNQYYTHSEGCIHF